MTQVNSASLERLTTYIACTVTGIMGCFAAYLIRMILTDSRPSSYRLMPWAMLLCVATALLLGATILECLQQRKKVSAARMVETSLHESTITHD